MIAWHVTLYDGNAAEKRCCHCVMGAHEKEFPQVINHQRRLKLSPIFEGKSQKALVRPHFNTSAVHFVGLRVTGAPAKLEMITSVLESTAFKANNILERRHSEVNSH